MKISKETYDLFCKHGSEQLWLSDPIRESKPKGINEKTEEDFILLEQLDENMELFYNNNYSQKLKKEYAIKIENLKAKMTDEVFTIIEKKYKK